MQIGLHDWSLGEGVEGVSLNKSLTELAWDWEADWGVPSMLVNSAAT